MENINVKKTIVFNYENEQEKFIIQVQKIKDNHLKIFFKNQNQEKYIYKANLKFIQENNKNCANISSLDELVEILKSCKDKKQFILKKVLDHYEFQVYYVSKNEKTTYRFILTKKNKNLKNEDNNNKNINNLNNYTQDCQIFNNINYSEIKINKSNENINDEKSRINSIQSKENEKNEKIKIVDKLSNFLNKKRNINLLKNIDFESKKEEKKEINENTNPKTIESETIKIDKIYKIPESQNKYCDITIKNYLFKFPYNPYKTQIEYMNTIFNSLDNDGHDALLESPTGTGKTLSLLCSTLTWNKKNKFTLENSNYSYEKDIKFLKLKKMIKSNKNLKLSVKIEPNEINGKRIIYCTRTHSQIQGVVNELKKIKDYYNINIAVLCSKDKLCPNKEKRELLETIKAENENKKKEKEEEERFKINNITKKKKKKKDEDEITLSDICQKYRDECQFYKNFENIFMRQKDLEYFNESGIFPEYPDIEDLKKCGEKEKVCPVYYMKEKLKSADLILMPYNYIFNDYFRYIMKLNCLIKNSIIIVDEGHNLQNVCEESKTRNLDFQELVESEEFLQDYLNELNEKNKKQSQEQNQKDVELKKIECELAKKFIRTIKVDLFEFFEKNNSSSINLNVEELLKIFHYDEYDIYLEIIRNISNYFNANLTKTKLKKVYNFLYLIKQLKLKEKIFGKISDNYLIKLSTEYDYLKNSNKIKMFNIAPNPYTDNDFEISINCFNPGIEFKEITKCSPKKIIITSGTLNSKLMFEKEFKHEFKEYYSGEHIINKENVIFKIITQYYIEDQYQNIAGKNYNLFDTFEFVYDKEVIKKRISYYSIGYLLRDLSQITPGGIIVFFTSFKVLEDCVNEWKKNINYPKDFYSENLFRNINNNKEIIIDDEKIIAKQKMLNNNEQYKNTPLRNFKNLIDNNPEKGAIFLSVLRGKASEGIDFIGDYGRMVINIGIPFAKKEGKIGLKEEFMKYKKESFSEYYKENAFLALNQACGRIIRNKDDYGVILNIDIRNKRYFKYYSNWLKTLDYKIEKYCYSTTNDNNINKNKFLEEIKMFFIKRKNNK